MRRCRSSRDGPGFHPRKILLGGHDAPSRKSGAHRRRHRQAFAQGAPSRDVSPD
jgi:hypothetical protein